MTTKEHKELFSRYPHLVPLYNELEHTQRIIEARRTDDLFVSRAMIRFGKALVAYHEAVLKVRRG